LEFLGIGYQELLLVLVLLLVVVGPERLPGMAYQIGRAVRQMQRYARSVRDEFSDEFEYIEEQYRTVRGELDTTRSGLREQQTRFESEMRAATAPLNEPLIPADSNGASAQGSTRPAGASETTVTEAPAPVPGQTETDTAPAGSGDRPPLVF
jgi:sec-independent protein translocase protein TatB